MGYTFKAFQKEAVIKHLGLNDYKYIMDTFTVSKDIKEDYEFQKKFNYFYKVRRNEAWRVKFYGLFQELKSVENVTFERIHDELHERTGNWEASFASKMLATINPNKPIWDSKVLESLDIKAPEQNKQLDTYVEVYNKIVMKEEELLARKDIRDTIDAFNEVYGEYQLSDIKILDFILWNGK